MITDGCVVKGTVKHSILFGGVVVEEGAVVEDAVVMGDTVIKRGAKVTHCIVAEGVTVGCDAVIGEKPAEDVTGDVAYNCTGSYNWRQSGYRSQRQWYIMMLRRARNNAKHEQRRGFGHYFCK